MILFAIGLLFAVTGVVVAMYVTGGPGLRRVALVVGGFVAAFLAALGAVVLNALTTSRADAQASSGMVAFGEVILFVGVFGCLAVLPTGAAIYFLWERFRRPPG